LASCGTLFTTTTHHYLFSTTFYYYRFPTIEELSRYPDTHDRNLACWIEKDFETGSQSKGIRILREKIPKKYETLANYLAAGAWKEADNETIAVMLKVANRESEGYLDKESIEKFPCDDLRVIDRLWVYYSGGRFGFSIQKRICEEMRDRGAVRKRLGPKMLDYGLGVDMLKRSGAPGHLPDLRRVCGYDILVCERGDKDAHSENGNYLAQRLVNCNI